MGPVGVTIPVAGLYRSALVSHPNELLTPPARRTNPLFSSVAVWPYRSLVSEPVNTTVETVSVVDPLTEPEVAVIVVCPCATGLATPVLRTIVATAVIEDVQVVAGSVVIFCVVPSVKVPVAVSATGLAEGAKNGFCGVIAIETSAGGPTLKFVEPQIDPAQAVMVTGPIATKSANPKPASLLMIAIEGAEELHTTEASWFPLLSVAVKLCEVPMGTVVRLPGFTEIVVTPAGVSVAG